MLAQLEGQLGAVDVQLSDEVLDAIDQIVPPGTNLNAADAQWFFGHFNIGDVVEVTNSGGPGLPLWDKYGDWAVSWSTWSAGNA